MNEHARLNALKSTGLLDTVPELRFDRLTRLASAALGTDIALISLVDEDRQWFKSRMGLAASETPRTHSFCSVAIESDGIMVIPDANEDSRFKDNPLVTDDPNISFYAGVPLVTGEGHALGTLCVIDSEPRQDFGDEEKQILSDIAHSVMTEIGSTQQAHVIENLSIVNEELRHRMGNMYAHVSSLVSLMARSGEDQKAFARRLRERISTLAQTQALIADYKFQSAPLSSIVDTTLSPLLTENTKKRVKMTANGTDFNIAPRGAFTLTLMLNELATNALKHGALKHPGGFIEFGWTSEGEDIAFEWKETSDADSSNNENHEGFGTQILTRIVPLDFQGTADHSMQAGGLTYRVSAKRNRLTE